MIAESHQVESYFGYWPEFADGKIERFAFLRSGSIELSISYIDGEKQVGATVSLKFSGVSEVDLSELRSENVLDALRISAGVPVQVSIEACYGLYGSFCCESVEVVALLPNHSLQARRP